MRALSYRHVSVGLTLGVCVGAIGGSAEAQNDGPQSAMEKLRRGEAAPTQQSYGAGAVGAATLQPDPATSPGPEIQALQVQLGEKDSKIGDLQGRVSSQDQLIDSLQAKLGEKDGQIGDLQGELSSRDGMIGSLQSQLSQKDSTIGDLKGRLASKDGLLDKLESQVATKNDLIGGLEDKLGVATTTLAGLESQVNGKDQRILGLEDKLGSLDRTMADMKVDLAKRDGLIGQLNERLTAAADSLKASEQRVAVLEQQVADGSARAAELEQQREAATEEVRGKNAEITEIGNALWISKSRSETSAEEIAALQTQRLALVIAVVAALVFAGIGWLRKPEPASRPPASG